MGRHLLQLGAKPGPEMGRILRQVFDLQVDGHVTDLESASAAAKEIIAKGPELTREWLSALRGQLKLL